MLVQRVVNRAVFNGSTTVEVSRMPLGLRWYRDKTLLEREPLSLADFTAIGDELKGLGARGDRATDVTVGTFAVTVKFSNIGVLLTMPLNEAETAFSELVSHALEISASHVICSTDRAEFKQGLAVVETLPLVEGAFALLATHGRKLAGIAEPEGEGTAVVFGGGRALNLKVVARAHEIAFALSE
jgi:hypothetical protein